MSHVQDPFDTFAYELEDQEGHRATLGSSDDDPSMTFLNSLCVSIASPLSSFVYVLPICKFPYQAIKPKKRIHEIRVVPWQFLVSRYGFL